MSRYGGIIAITGGILGFLASLFTLYIGGGGMVFGGTGIIRLVGFNWITPFFCVSVVLLAGRSVNTSQIRYPLLTLLFVLLAAYLGGKLVLLCMLFAGLGGILLFAGVLKSQEKGLLQEHTEEPSDDSGS